MMPQQHPRFADTTELLHTKLLAPHPHTHTIALVHVCTEQGELHQAAALYHDALTDALDGADLSDQGRATRGLAQLAYEWNDLDLAEQQAHSAVAIGKQISDEALQVQASLLLARIQHARNMLPPAQQHLAELLAKVSPHRTPELYREILANQARFQLSAGDLIAVQRWRAIRTRYGAEVAASVREQENILPSCWLPKASTKMAGRCSASCTPARWRVGAFGAPWRSNCLWPWCTPLAIEWMRQTRHYARRRYRPTLLAIVRTH